MPNYAISFLPISHNHVIDSILYILYFNTFPLPNTNHVTISSNLHIVSETHLHMHSMFGNQEHFV